MCLCLRHKRPEPYTNTTLGCHTKVFSLICVNCRDVLVKSWSFLPGDDKVVSQGVGSFVPTKASNLQYFLLLTQSAFIEYLQLYYVDFWSITWFLLVQSLSSSLIAALILLNHLLLQWRLDQLYVPVAIYVQRSYCVVCDQWWILRWLCKPSLENQSLEQMGQCDVTKACSMA